MFDNLISRYPSGPAAAVKDLTNRIKAGISVSAEEKQFLFLMQLFYGGVTSDTIPDVHKHQCPSCRFVWEHTRSKIPDSAEGYAAAHTCPKGCGIDVRDVYEDPDEELNRLYKEVMP